MVNHSKRRRGTRPREQSGHVGGGLRTLDLSYCPRLSDAALSVIFALTPEGYAMVVLWFLLGRVASALDMGPVYLLLSIVLFIFTNLGRRREGEASAYSIFNNFQTLPGQLTADQLDRQMVRGHIT